MEVFNSRLRIDMNAFKASHPDGRSDRQVIFDAVHEDEPDAVYPYDELIALLAEDLEVEVERPRAQAAVRSANRTLLEERKRYLRVVPGQGYRMIRSDEHLTVAIKRRQTAQKNIKEGLRVLRHTDLSELSGTQRQLHEGYMLTQVGVLQFMQHSEKKQSAQQDAIDSLKTRVEQLETKT